MVVADGTKLAAATRLIQPDHGPFASNRTLTHVNSVPVGSDKSHVLNLPLALTSMLQSLACINPIRLRLTAALVDEAYLGLTSSPHLGEMELQTFSVEILRAPFCDRPAMQAEFPLARESKVHDQSKKSGAHRVGRVPSRISYESKLGLTLGSSTLAQILESNVGDITRVLGTFRHVHLSLSPTWYVCGQSSWHPFYSRLRIDLLQVMDIALGWSLKEQMQRR